jgi:hypothetical protein
MGKRTCVDLPKRVDGHIVLNSFQGNRSLEAAGIAAFAEHLAANIVDFLYRWGRTVEQALCHVVVV